MTIEDPVARLSAGLAEDERIARAIDDKQFDSGWSVIEYPGDKRRWISPHIGQVHEDEAAEHIVRQDPARVLRQADAMRGLLRRYEEAERDSVLSDRDAGFEAGMYAALEILASIYTDEVEETP